MLNSTSQNYHKQYFWLIDRDFRINEELNALKSRKIYILPVWEFEKIKKKDVVKSLFDHLWREDFEEKFWKFQKALFDLKQDSKFKENFYKNYIHQKFNQNLANFKIGKFFQFSDNYSELNVLWKNIVNEDDYDKFL